MLSRIVLRLLPHLSLPLEAGALVVAVNARNLVLSLVVFLVTLPMLLVLLLQMPIVRILTRNAFLAAVVGTCVLLALRATLIRTPAFLVVASVTCAAPARMTTPLSSPTST